MSSDTAAPTKPLTAAALLMSGQAVRPVPIVPVGHEYEPALRRRNSSAGSSAPSSAAGSARPPDAKPTPVVKTAMQIAMEDMAALQLAEANMFAGAQVRKPNVARSGSTVHATQPPVPAPLKPTLLSAKADASPSSSAEFTLSADASAPPLQNAAPKKTPSATKMSSSTHVVVSDDEFTFSPDAKPPAAKPAAAALAVPKPPSGAALSDLISSDDEEHFSLGRAPEAAAAPPAVAEPAPLHSKTSLRVSVVKQDAVEKPPPSLYTGSTSSFHHHHSGSKQRHESVVKATPGSLRNAVSPDEGGAMEKSTRRSAIQSAATTTFSIASDSAHPSPGTTTATPATALVSGPSDDATEPPPLPAAKAGPATSGFVHRDSVASSTGFSSVPSDSDDESHSQRRSSNNMASKPTPPKPVAPSKISEPSLPAQVPLASNRGAAAVANAFGHKESGVKRRLRPAGSTAASSAAPSVEATPLLASSGLGADKKSPFLQASEDAKALRKAKSEGSLLNSKQPSPAAGLLATSGSATVLPAADAYAKAKQDAEQLLASQREKPVAAPAAPLALSSSHDANAYQRAREDVAKLVAIQAAPPLRDLQPSASSGSLSARAPLGTSGPSLSGADAYRRAKDDAAALISSQQSSPPGGLAALPPRSFSAPALPTPPSQTHLASSSRGAGLSSQQPTAASAALGTLRVERRRDAPPAVAFTGEIVTAATPTPESRQLDSQTDMIGGGGSGATAAALFLTKTRDPSPVKRSTAARPTQGPTTSPTKRTTATTISPTTQRTKQAAGDNALVVRRAAATSNGSAIVPQPPSPSSAMTTPRKIFVDSVSVGATEVVVPASSVPTTVCVLPTNGHSYAATADTAPPPAVVPPLYALQQPLTTSTGAAPPMQLQAVTLLDGSTALAVMPFAVPQAPSMAMVTPRQQPTQQLALAAPQTMQPPQQQQQHQPSGMSVLMDGRGAALVDPSGAALMGPLQALHAPTAGRQYLQQHPPVGGSAAPLAPEEALRQVAASRWYANAPDSIQKLLRVQPAASQGTQLTPRNPNVQVDDALLANFLSANPRPAHGEYRQLYAVQQQNPMRYNNGQQPSNDNRGWWGGQPQQQQPQAASARGGNVQGGLIEQLALLNQSTSARRQRVQQWGY